MSVVGAQSDLAALPMEKDSTRCDAAAPPEENQSTCCGSSDAASSQDDPDRSESFHAATQVEDQSGKSHSQKRWSQQMADSWFCLEGKASDCNLPVDGARLYNSAVKPVPLPSGLLKLLVLPLFCVICIGWHMLQRKLQLDWHVPGEPGQAVEFTRARPGGVQVVLNALCVAVLSIYPVSAYIFHQKILDFVLNPLFTPRTWVGHNCVALAMFGIAVASSFFLTTNWVAAAAGLFMFFGYAVCGRTVQASASRRSQIGLGPSRADEDAGASFHVGGSSGVESGLRAGEGQAVEAALLEGDAGETEAGGKLRFATVRPDDIFVLGDDAVVVEQAQDGACAYHAPCGRANIFRLDCLVVLALSFGARLPQFVIGGGGFNQCAGLVELLVSLVYIPIGYTCFAVFGFRVGLANRWSMAVVLVLCLWPLINLVLGGKGVGTLVDLVSGEYLPQIWDPSATALVFNRGFASCSESAYAVGGETLLVASTTIAAWVHIMSNFSFLFGFISGMLRMRGSAATVTTVFIN